MKQLLFFSSDFKIGLSQLLTDQLISLDRAGVPYIAIAGEGEQEDGLGGTLRDKGIQLIRVKGLDLHANFMRLVREVSNIIVERKVEIVHVQNNWQLAIVSTARLKILAKRRFKIVYTLHGFRHNSPIKAFIARGVIGSALFLFADHVICMTEYLKRKFRFLSYKIEMIPLGVKDDYFENDFIPPSTASLRLIFPAQFRHGKNQDMVIRAFAEYVDRTKDRKSTLVLPGKGELLDDMQRLASSLGVGEQVEFPGFISKQQIKQEYLNSNIAIVASNSETFGQSIVEPFVLGRCVISTPVGVATEIIHNDVTGYVYNSEQNLVDVLMDLAIHREKLKTIGRENFNRRSMFSWKSVTARYIKALL